jgi:hypothetical protein
MGQKLSNNVIGYESVQNSQSSSDAIIINTMPANKQRCLIAGTLSADQEEKKINELLRSNRSITILVYGENSCDLSPNKKTVQLRALGFRNVSEYRGGLFEWLLLQEVYGESNFQTTAPQIDILKYGPPHTQTLALTQF